MNAELLAFMPFLNMLIVAALVFVVRVDRRVGQMDVLAAAKGTARQRQRWDRTA